MTNVVSAAIISLFDDGIWRMLLAQRGAGSYAYCWCTPGGKVNEGESEMDALRRELREELKLEIDALCLGVAYIHTGRRTTASGDYVLTCYLFRTDEFPVAMPQPKENIISAGWFSADELEHLRLAGADTANREKLIDCLRKVVSA